MPLDPTSPSAIVLGTPTYWRINSLHIDTPQNGDDGIVIAYAAYLNDTDTTPLKTFRADIAGADLAALMAAAPQGSTLYGAIKAAAYTYLQAKGLMPAGTVT